MPAGSSRAAKSKPGRPPVSGKSSCCVSEGFRLPLSPLPSFPNKRKQLTAAGAADFGGTPEKDQDMAATATDPASPDAPLLEKARNGDAEAFYRLIQPHERTVFLVARGILDNDADAEDVAQEAFLKAFSHLSSFRGDAKFSTWLVQIAINEARQRLRKDRRHLYESLDAPREEEEGDYIPRDFADWREIPSDALQQAQLRTALSQALDSLAPKYRSVFVLRDIQQLNIAETAKMLGITEASVKTRLRRARLMMRDALAPGWDGAWQSGASYRKVRGW